MEPPTTTRPDQPVPHVAEDLRSSAPRRTWMAAERTYLAWLRTALASLALAVAIGRLLPALVAGSHVAFGLVGACYGLFAVLVLIMGALRMQRVRAALIANKVLPTDVWTLWVLTAIGVVLAVATVVLVIVEV